MGICKYNNAWNFTTGLTTSILTATVVNCLTVYGMETFSRAGLHSGWSTVWESLIQKWVRSQIFSSLFERPFSVRDGLNMILHFGIFQRWTAAMHWTWAPRLIFAYHWMSFKEGFQLDAAYIDLLQFRKVVFFPDAFFPPNFVKEPGMEGFPSGPPRWHLTWSQHRQYQHLFPWRATAAWLEKTFKVREAEFFGWKGSWKLNLDLSICFV